MKRSASSSQRLYWVSICFVLSVFLLGGGSRGDILSLVVLRPLAALAFAYGLFTLTRADFDAHYTLFQLLGLITFITLVHLVPLPPSVWAAMPGRSLIADIGEAAGLGDVWRPLSMTPRDGWNAFFSLLIPAATLSLASGLNPRQHKHLIALILAIAFGSIVIGILQLQGSPDGRLYFYRITNQGELVGLFSNRNHHAMFLATMLPVIAFLGSGDAKDSRALKMQLGCVFAGVLFILAALAVNGSRGGFALGILGLSLAVWQFQPPRALGRRHDDKFPVTSPRTRRLKMAGVLSLTAAAATILAFPASKTLGRVLGTNSTDENRFNIWRETIDLAWQYFPFGSGSGSFADVFKIAEAQADLRFEYVNHAHNDWLEIFLTFGLPGLLILSALVGYWAACVRQVFAGKPIDDDEVRMARLGGAITLLLAIGSIVDYPLRTPSLACLFTLAFVWLMRGAASSKVDSGKH